MADYNKLACARKVYLCSILELMRVKNDCAKSLNRDALIQGNNSLQSYTQGIVDTLEMIVGTLVNYLTCYDSYKALEECAKINLQFASEGRKKCT